MDFKLVNISDLYQLPSQSTTFELSYFLIHTEHDDFAYSDLPNHKIETRVVWRQDFDFRRYWQLATVWMDGKPFGVIQNAGREGRDHLEAFWTDADTYVQAIRYVRSIAPVETIPDITDVNFDQPELLTFSGLSYGEEYRDYF